MSMPAFFSAAMTRSRDSFTSLPRDPTMLIEGKPEVASTSTCTMLAWIPNSAPDKMVLYIHPPLQKCLNYPYKAQKKHAKTTLRILFTKMGFEPPQNDSLNACAIIPYGVTYKNE
jgi:hypothetical protein